MKKQNLRISGIPAILWGEPSEHVYLYVHGKQSCKELAEEFAQIAQEKGFQTLSFDLPQHGERREEPTPCDIVNGMHDLRVMSGHIFLHWKHASLDACSLGAYFSLQTFAREPFECCLFQSPIVDMEALVRQMMVWFDVTPERLERERRIETPIDTLDWEYYGFIRSHPVTVWPIRTRILYAGRDALQTPETMRTFARRFGCALPVAQESEHPFMGEGDGLVVRSWLRENI